MAYSIIEFKNKSMRFHDLDLAVACFLLMSQKVGSKPEFVDKLFEDWVDSISYDGPGCIDLHLNENLVNTEEIQAVKDLIDATKQSLDKVSNLYPKDELNPILAKAKITLESDYRIDLIKGALSEFKSLID
jgi:hypothetical protein